MKLKFEISLARNFCRSILACCAVIGLEGEAFGGGVLYVDAGAASGGDGASWATAFAHLQDAYAIASIPSNGISEIRVAQGVYRADSSDANPAGTNNREATFQLLNNVQFIGGYEGMTAVDPDSRDPNAFPTILDGDLLGDDVPDAPLFDPTLSDNTLRMIDGSNVDATAVLDGFTIRSCNSYLGPNPAWGAGMFCDSGSPILRNCRFVQNYSYNGGAIYARNNSGISFANCDFLNNHAQTSGGAMWASNSDCTFVDCLFESNRSLDSRGGAMMLSVCDAEFEQCRFVGNHAAQFGTGGALELAQVQGAMRQCTFESNHAGDNGGAAHISSTSAVNIVECQFIGNTSIVRAGAVGVGEYSDILIVSTLFKSNTSERAGGLYYDSPNAELTVIDCDFIGNTGTVFCGGFCLVLGEARVINSRFIGNSGGTRGGGCYTTESTSIQQKLSFDGTLFADNTAVRGGAIYDTADRTKYVNCTMVNNSADQQGGGIWNNGVPGVITNCIIQGNASPLHPQIYSSFSTTIMRHNNIEGSGGSGGGWNAMLGIDLGGNIDADPMYVDADGPDDDPQTFADNNYRLSAGSPCIDAGHNWALPEDDFDVDNDALTNELLPIDGDNMPRIANVPSVADTGCGNPAVVDVGAYEFQGLPLDNLALGDLNGDGFVNVTDLFALLSAWDVCSTLCCPGDLDMSRAVDVGDLFILLSNWN